MDRYRRLTRRLYLFAGVLALGVLLVVVRAAATVEIPSGKALPQVFPPIDLNALRVIELEKKPTALAKPGGDEPKGPRLLRLERTGVASWTLATSDGYPADAKKIEDFVKGLVEVRSLAEVTTSPEKFAAFAGDDGFTDVRLYAAAGEDPSHAFGIGKANALGSWSNTFLRLDEVRRTALGAGGAGAGGRILAVKGIDAWADRTDLLQWIEPRFFPGLADSDIVDVAWSYVPKSFEGIITRGPRVEGETDETFLVSTRGPDGGPSAPAAAKRDTAKQVISALTGLRLAGVVGRAAEGSDATYGFDAPSLVVTGRAKRPRDDMPTPLYRIEIGKKVEGKSTFYARRSMVSGPDPWVFTVNEYELGRLQEDPADLLEKKPEPPAPPADAPAAMEDAPAPPTPDAPGTPDEPPTPKDVPPAMEDAPVPPGPDAPNDPPK